MSMETHVFFRGRLPSKATLSRAMKELGLPFSITPATGSLEAQSGFLPMKLRGEETGVEFDVYGDHAAVEEFADAGVDPSFERRASLRWGGDFEEAVAGMCVAAALAKLVGGVVFDEAEDRLLSVDDAIAVARRNLQGLVKPEEKKRPGAKTADLRRYLKPLLKQRSDLVLIGRLLIIRPVRHLLRGAFFDHSSDKYQFQVSRWITPLFEPDGTIYFRKPIHPGRFKVWKPDFEPLLFDALAEDVFDDVGRIRALGDLDRELNDDISLLALLLGGERERAAELSNAERMRRGRMYEPEEVQKRRALLERDVTSLCDEFRLRESKAAEWLKLGDIWEPAPFPAEIPEAERAQRCDDPLFLTKPWIPRPPRLVEDPPNTVGEVRFARDVLWRKGGVTMFRPLTREEAEEKHRTRQHYALAVRLPDGHLLAIRHSTGWSPHSPDQPKNPNYVPSRTFLLEIFGPRGRLLYVEFNDKLGQRGVMEMRSARVCDPIDQYDLWYAFNDYRERTKNIYDHRDSPYQRERRPMTDSDLSLCEFAEPRFVDADDLWRRVETYLQNEGFGTLRNDAKS
jgi:hypothetical protein